MARLSRRARCPEEREMRPPLTRGRLDLPRWRRRRAADLYAVSAIYMAALLVYGGLVSLICFMDGGLASRSLDFTASVLIAFLIVVYLALGGLVVGVAVRRLANWIYSRAFPFAGNWMLVLFWPVSVGGLMLKAALLPSR